MHRTELSFGTQRRVHWQVFVAYIQQCVSLAQVLSKDKDWPGDDARADTDALPDKPYLCSVCT